jgi:hypothetical protein
VSYKDYPQKAHQMLGEEDVQYGSPWEIVDENPRDVQKQRAPVVTSISVIPEDEDIHDGRNDVRGVFNWV